MDKKKKFKTEVISREEADLQLGDLRAESSGRRASRFDPLKQHIQWLNRKEVLRIEEMKPHDVANLRSFIARNVSPVDKGTEFVVRSARVDDSGTKFRVFISLEDAA